MAVIDELVIIEKGESKIVDSADNGIIDEIEVDNNLYHFAKQNQVYVICDNAVEEPIVDMTISGNSVQDGTPTPETPIEVESVGEKTNNLLDTTKIQDDDTSRIQLTRSKNELKAKLIGTPAYSAMFFAKITINNLKPNTNYYLSGIPSIAAVQNVYVYADRLWGTQIKAFSINGTSNYFNTGNNTSVVIGFYWNAVQNYEIGTEITLSNIQLEEGSKTEYEPYGYKVPINIKTNLYNPNTIVNNKYISSSGVETDTVNLFRTDYFNVVANTEYVLKFSTTSNANIVAFAWYDSNKTFISRSASETITGQNLEFKAVAPSNAKFAICNLINNSTEISITSSILTNIYLKEPLRKIGDYADYIDYKNKKVVRNVKENILRGSSYIFLWSSYGSAYLHSTDINKGSDNLQISGLCSHLPPVSSSDIYAGRKQGVSTNKGYTQFVFYIQGFTTIEEYKTYFDEQYSNGTPVKIYYALATPIEETIEIPEISTEKGTNNFVAETTIEPSELKITYWKQIGAVEAEQQIIQSSSNILIIRTGADITQSGSNLTIGE